MLFLVVDNSYAVPNNPHLPPDRATHCWWSGGDEPVELLATVFTVRLSVSSGPTLLNLFSGRPGSKNEGSIPWTPGLSYLFQGTPPWTYPWVSLAGDSTNRTYGEIKNGKSDSGPVAGTEIVRRETRGRGQTNCLGESHSKYSEEIIFRTESLRGDFSLGRTTNSKKCETVGRFTRVKRECIKQSRLVCLSVTVQDI